MARRDKFIHFRADEQLIADIDRLAAEANTTRSHVTRTLLYRAMGNTEQAAAIAAAMMDFHGAIKRAVGRATMDMAKELPTYVREELQR
jgi:hypothetical protein